MNMAAAAFAAFVVIAVGGVAHAGESDQSIRDYLEGDWLVGEKPENGACTGYWYSGTELEFEFRKSSGRMLTFEHFDLFTAVVISRIDRQGDRLSLEAKTRDGGYAPIGKLRILRPDRIEVDPGNGKSAKVAYRCGVPDLAVNTAVPIDKLAKLTPLLSGGFSFIEAVPGIPDADLCRRETSAPAPFRRWLQFELIGPDHYWVFGQGGNFLGRTTIGFDFVRGVQATPQGLKLAMQRHLEAGGGWDVPASRGETYKLTILDHGGRIEIPELSGVFVRCSPADEASRGMHRY